VCVCGASVCFGWSWLFLCVRVYVDVDVDVHPHTHKNTQPPTHQNLRACLEGQAKEAILQRPKPPVFTPAPFGENGDWDTVLQVGPALVHHLPHLCKCVWGCGGGDGGVCVCGCVCVLGEGEGAGGMEALVCVD
jgi:hypothetical protein